MWAAQYFEFNTPRSWISSRARARWASAAGGDGRQGGHPDKLVIDIDGDGSFLMNIQELATCYCEKMPVKVLLLNNQHLGMVVQWEDRFHDGNRGPHLPRRDRAVGATSAVSRLRHDRQGLRLRRPHRQQEGRPDDAIEEMIDTDGPYLLDVKVPYQEHVLPMIPAGRTVRDMQGIIARALSRKQCGSADREVGGAAVFQGDEGWMADLRLQQFPDRLALPEHRNRPAGVVDERLVVVDADLVVEGRQHVARRGRAVLGELAAGVGAPTTTPPFTPPPATSTLITSPQWSRPGTGSAARPVFIRGVRPNSPMTSTTRRRACRAASRSSTKQAHGRVEDRQDAASPSRGWSGSPSR